MTPDSTVSCEVKEVNYLILSHHPQTYRRLSRPSVSRPLRASHLAETTLVQCITGVDIYTLLYIGARSEPLGESPPAGRNRYAFLAATRTRFATISILKSIVYGKGT